MVANIGALIITYTIFGASWLQLEYNGHQNPILIIKAPKLGFESIGLGSKGHIWDLGSGSAWRLELQGFRS